MMQSLRRYRALRVEDRSLVREAACAAVLIRLGISAMRFTAFRKTLDRAVRVLTRGPTAMTPDEIRRIAWSVGAVTQRLPFSSTCLVQSLAVDAMLRRRGVPSAICLGVQPPDGGTLAAHAWVEHDGQVVFGARSDLAEYRVLVRQGAG
jgi:hypothetical protein